MDNNLYKIKSLFSFRQFLSSGEKITCVDGSLKRLVVGTNRGRILCLHMQNDAVVLDFATEIPSNLSVSSLVHASAFDNILALVSSKLYLIEEETGKIHTASVTVDVVAFSLNTNPTVDSPYVLQFAVSTGDKQIIVYLLERKELTVQIKFRAEKNAVCLCYSGRCICFATSQSYFIHDLTTNTTRSLFPYDPTTTRPLIINVDVDEFLLNGMQGLGVFATVTGVSSRPPLVWGSERICSFVCRSSKIFVLNVSSVIIFDCFNGIEEIQRIAVENGEIICNLDGQIIFSKSEEFCLLEEICWLKRAEQFLTENKIEEALCTAKNALLRSNDPATTLNMKYIQERAAMKYFFAGEFEKSRELGRVSEMDPRKYVVLYKRLLPLPSGAVFTMEDPYPDETFFYEDRCLVFLKNYLMDIREQAWEESVRRDLNAAMLRLMALCEEEFDSHFCKGLTFSYEDNKVWLLDNGYKEYLMMAMIHSGAFSEAFDLMSENSATFHANKKLFHFYIGNIGRISSKELALKTLQLLHAIDAEIVFQHASDESLRPFRLEIINWFESKPLLLIKLLEEWRSTDGTNLDTRLIKLYISEIARGQTELASNANELGFYRKRLRELILTSVSYSRDEVIQDLKKYHGFLVELIFARAKKGEDSEKCLKELLRIENFDAAETLCFHLNPENPKLYGALLKFYIHLASEQPEIGSRARDVFNTMEVSTIKEAIDILSDIPEDWLFCPLSVYARKAILKAKAQNSCALIKKAVLGTSTNELTWEMRGKTSKSVVIDEQTTCYICGKQVAPDDARFNFHSKLFTHIDCR